jgi:uncharacterized membrane protein
MLIPMAAIGVLIYVASQDSEPDHSVDDTPEMCWHWGGIYNNPQDPSLFVRARVGTGYTLNMGHRWSYGIMIGLPGGILALAGFLLWSQR